MPAPRTTAVPFYAMSKQEKKTQQINERLDDEQIERCSTFFFCSNRAVRLMRTDETQRNDVTTCIIHVIFGRVKFMVGRSSA